MTGREREVLRLEVVVYPGFDDSTPFGDVCFVSAPGVHSVYFYFYLIFNFVVAGVNNFEDASVHVLPNGFYF